MIVIAIVTFILKNKFQKYNNNNNSSNNNNNNNNSNNNNNNSNNNDNNNNNFFNKLELYSNGLGHITELINGKKKLLH